MIKNILNSRWLIAAIVVLAAVLRLWHLTSVPPSLTQDEASLGYNAYSILKTGRDEFGQTLPIVFKSFGDYKPGLYVYLDVPFVATIGLSELSVRLPSALMGILSVYLLYLIAKRLFPQNDRMPIMISLVASFNPWLIYFSRAAWEANVSLCFTLIAIYFFLKSRDKFGSIIYSFVFFALTLLTYQGAKISSLIVVGALIMTYWGDCKKLYKFAKKQIFVGFLLALIIAFPILLTFLNGQASRLAVFSIFSYRRPVAEISKLASQGNEQIGSMGFAVMHSETINYLRAILGRYFNNFSPRFLFFEGDWANPISTAPYQGVMQIIDLITLPLGLLAIFRKKLSKGYLFVLLWLIMAPFSVALSRDEVNAVRDLNLAIPLIVISASGIIFFFNKFRERRFRALYFIGFGAVSAFSLIYFLDAYFVHVPAHNSFFWRYGYKQAFEYINPVQSSYRQIYFEQSYNQPYIYYLFYKAAGNPAAFDVSSHQSQEKLSGGVGGDVGFENKIDNINFVPINWETLKKLTGDLVILSPRNLPPNWQDNASLLDEVKYLNGRDVAFDILLIK